MDDLENKLGAILNNPQMMQQIMEFARNMGAEPAKEGPAQLPGLDISMLQKIAQVSGSGKVQPKEQTLLNALKPYISQHRLNRLERAMRAARVAGMATAFLGTGR